MPRKFGKSIDLNLKESHEGFHTLSKCPKTIGYAEVTAARKSNSGTVGSSISSTSRTTVSAALKAKRQSKAMSIAMKPGQQVFMNAFMMYMSGKTLNIFSISVTSMAILTPLASIFKIESTFAPFELENQLPKLVFVACNLAWLGLGLYKMSSMRLLPNTSADWTDSIVWKDMMETTSIPPPM